jgi:large subunit ribosomal protein L4
MQVDVTNLNGDSVGQLELSDAVFGLEPRADILHRVVTWQLAKRRAGTHKAKGKGEISRTTAKMYKQKGTGRARHGSRKPGVFRGGGKAHGPLPHSHETDLPKKLRALGLRHALSAKAKAGELIVLENGAAAEPKTRPLAKQLEKLGWRDVLLIDGAELDANMARASRNLVELQVLPVQGANVYDILRRGRLALTRAAVEQLEARLK